MMARVRPWLPALAWALGLLWLGGREVTAPVRMTGLDKVGHFLLYGVLGVLAGIAWRRTRRVPRPAMVLAIACAVGLADELHQSRVPGRSADPFDFIADAAGVLLGFAAGTRLPVRETTADEA